MKYNVNDILECTKEADGFLKDELYEIIDIQTPAYYNSAPAEYLIYDSYSSPWWLTASFLDGFFIKHGFDNERFDYAMEIL